MLLLLPPNLQGMIRIAQWPSRKTLLHCCKSFLVSKEQFDSRLNSFVQQGSVDLLFKANKNLTIMKYQEKKPLEEVSSLSDDFHFKQN